MIDWTFAAIAFVAGGIVVHVLHEAIWWATADRMHREVMRRIREQQERHANG